MVFTDGNLNVSANSLPNVGAGQRVFSPNADGSLDVATLDADINGGGAETNVLISIRAGTLITGATVRTLAPGVDYSPPPNGMSFQRPWDGKDGSNVDVAEGVYTARIFSNQQPLGASEVSNPRRIELLVDRTAPVISGAQVLPNPTSPGTDVTLTATATDALTQITAAEYRVAAGPWLPMTPTSPPFNALSEGLTVTFAAPGAGTYAVCVRARDLGQTWSDGTHCSSLVVQSENQAPSVNAGADATIDEGGTFTGSGSFTDPDADTWSATVDYGDRSPAQPLTLVGKTFSLSHAYPQDGVFTVIVTVTDDEGASNSDQIAVTVNNVLPNVNAGSGATINEGGTFTGSGSFTDPGADTWTATVNYGDGTPTQSLTLTPAKTFSLNHTYADNTGGPFTVTVTVSDDDGAGNGTTSVIVLNVAPVITTPLTIPGNPIATTTPVTMTWNFTDPGSDTWQCRISWDLPTVSGDPIAFDPPFDSNGNSCSATKTLAAGIYTVTVHVKDDDGGSDQETATSYIVVYDPTAGFVTGGGWIMSPAGAYVGDASLTGKANFGFVSKYKKGMNSPDGNTEFQFHAGNLNFKSSSYDWLVVATFKGQFKGVGSINGVPGYYFMLSAVDGQINGGGGTDKFRMKIWKIVDDAEYVVYDNQMGGAIDAEPTTTLGGGSIVIHSGPSFGTLAHALCAATREPNVRHLALRIRQGLASRS